MYNFDFINFFFLRFYLFIFRERGREKERVRNINRWLHLLHPPLGTQPATQACGLSRNQISDFLVHRPALNPLSHTSQGRFYYSYIFREKGREREKHRCETETSIGWLLYVPHLGLNLQPRHVPWQNQTSKVLLCRIMPNQLSHTDEGLLFYWILIVEIDIVVFYPALMGMLLMLHY